MHTRLSPHLIRLIRVRATHAAAALGLAFTLVAGLACDENAPTETRAPAGPTDVGSAGDGSEVLGDFSAMAIALPVDQSVATTAPAPAFRIRQTGSGPNGIFQISNSSNTQSALQGLTNGLGRAGFFRITNTSNGQAALQGQTNGGGTAVQGTATGTGGAGVFEVLNSGNSRTSLIAHTTGNGMAAFFQTSKALNNSPTVFTLGFGRGPAGRFEVRNTGNPNSALEALSNNSGRAFLSHQSGSGPGATIRIANPNNTRAALEVATSGTGDAIVTTGDSRFFGDLTVFGTLSKSAGSFKIDHPLDPEHKYLSHSFVESPDMKNVYDGTVTLDANGRATVELPEYFEALNRDFRYQLTAIGAPGPNLYIAEGVTQNRFKIAGGRAHARVSWMVTGIRQDTYANEHRIRVEEEKPASERGLVARR